MYTRNTRTVASFRRYAVPVILGALALSSTGVSLAGDSSDVRQVTVKFADLNVSSPQGAAALYSRIRAAAKTVCSPDAYHLFPSGSGVSACIQKAIADAVTKVNQPALYAVYNEHYKTPLPSTLLSQGR